MLPVIAIAGRPNVGKSTLFNVLTRSRDALVADVPGLTRDRQYGFGRIGPVPYLVVDTGGLSGDEEGIDGLMAVQTRRALNEADIILFMVDVREGATVADQKIANDLRKMGKQVFLVANKIDGLDADTATADFYSLGLGDPLPIAASHGRNVAGLMDLVLEGSDPEVEDDVDDDRIRVAVVGRPNVGKSTLINRLLGEERLVAFDAPGTTRDSVFVPFERDGTLYTLIDTAGIRRKSKVHDTVEKFSVIKALKAIDIANVVVAMLDAREGVTDQDASLLGLTVHRGRALVIAINKWDGLETAQRDDVRRLIDVKLPFLDFARIHFISALHGSGVGNLLESVNDSHAAAQRELSTPELTRVLEQAVERHPPPRVKGRRPRLRYAHQGGRNPPVIVIHGNQTDSVADAYQRYLTKTFRKAFKLQGTPVRVTFKTGKNPYAGKRNTLTGRQLTKRKRLMRHVKSGRN